MANVKPKQLKMKQIVSGQWSSEAGIESYSIVGLGVDGKVYRYDVQREGWIAWSMKEVEARRSR